MDALAPGITGAGALNAYPAFGRYGYGSGNGEVGVITGFSA